MSEYHIQYEEKTGKKAIWKNKETKGFKDWFEIHDSEIIESEDEVVENEEVEETTEIEIISEDLSEEKMLRQQLKEVQEKLKKYKTTRGSPEEMRKLQSMIELYTYFNKSYEEVKKIKLPDYTLLKYWKDKDLRKKLEYQIGMISKTMQKIFALLESRRASFLKMKKNIDSEQSE